MEPHAGLFRVLSEAGEQAAVGEQPAPLIERALELFSTVVVEPGEYLFRRSLHTPRPGVSLIIKEGAQLLTNSETELDKIQERTGDYIYTPFIHNRGHDDVAIINFGTITGGIYYNGRNGGRIGIDGGLFFSTGSMDGIRENWIVDAANVSVPLLCADDYTNAVLVAEGCDHLDIGTVAALNTDAKENEAVDLNGLNEGVRIDHAIGTSPSKHDEILDINSSRDVFVNRVTGFNVGRYEPLVSRLNYEFEAIRLSQAEFFAECSNIWIDEKVRKKRPDAFRTEVEVPELPQALPTFDVAVTLVAEFGDRSETVFNKTFSLDLRRGASEPRPDSLFGV